MMARGSERRKRTGGRRWREGVALVLGTALVMTSVPVSGDEAPPTGPRVRVTLGSSGKKIVGRLLEANDDVLVLGRRHDDRIEPIEVPRSDVLALEVSERRSRKGTGATIGLVAGAAVAIAVGMAGGGDCPEHPGTANWGNF